MCAQRILFIPKEYIIHHTPQAYIIGGRAPRDRNLVSYIQQKELIPMIDLNIAKTELHLGLLAPVRLLQITDAHISRAYPREMDDPQKFAHRKAAFDGDLPNGAEKRFEALLAYAKANSLLPVFTGDIWDYMSEANFEYWDLITSGLDHIYCAGNHDFCTWPGADKEDHAYKLSALPRVLPHVKDHPVFSSRIINGVNLVCIDDGYYLFTPAQLDSLIKEVEKGLPIVLFMHVPLFAPAYADLLLHKNPACAYLTAPTEDYLKTYQPFRAAQQRPDDITCRMVDYIKSQPLIKAVFAGHIHDHHEHALTPTLPQFVTASAYHAAAREIVIR